MGVSRKNLIRLARLHESGLLNVGDRMLELGSQNIDKITGEELRQVIAEFRRAPVEVDLAVLDEIADGGTMASLMKLCGLSYLALDIFETEDCIVFDLNRDPVPEDLRGKFDLVTNFGTTEHIINQYHCFACVHDFTKLGGLIYHDLPMGGYFYHGYYSYTPLFFKHLAEANNYEMISRNFSKSNNVNPAPEELKRDGWPDSGFFDASSEFIFRKTEDHPFRLPIDGRDDRRVNREFLSSRPRPNVVVRERES